jgi:hypothetical protein
VPHIDLPKEMPGISAGFGSQSVAEGATMPAISYAFESLV